MAALLIVAVAIWLGLVPQVLGHWQVPTIGASFILTVATESLALLAATLAFGERAGWLLYASLAPFCLGLAFYAFVLGRFQFRQISVGIGDHWVTGGALAISTVAAGRIAVAAQRTGALSGALGALKTIALVLWCVTMVWLPVLVGAEILRPRLTYNVRRWSTVFPVGMYAACSFVVGPVSGIKASQSSRASGCGLRSPCGWSCSPRCSAARRGSCAAGSDGWADSRLALPDAMRRQIAADERRMTLHRHCGGRPRAPLDFPNQSG